jgi:eukaryotic-like serine/threonine-protein kinase
MQSHFELPTDSILGGDFRIRSPLRRGYLKSTYVAEQVSRGINCMLTVLHPQLVFDSVSRDRFEHEIGLAAQVSNEHVAHVLGGGVDDATQVGWVATELLDGPDLASYLEKRGALPFTEVCEIFAQIGRGLGAAHAVGLVHRDLNLQTIFMAETHLGDPFSVKLLDFGVGHLVTSAQRLGPTGFEALLFQAPEQAIPGKPMAAATDFWALGLLAFRMLTGFHYWHCANVQAPQARDLVREIVLEPIGRPSDRALALGCAHLVPPGLDDWFTGCMARSIDSRFGRVAELCAMLDALAVRAGVPSRISSMPLPGPTSRTLAPVSAPQKSALPALLGGAVVGVLFVLLYGRLTSEPHPAALGAELGTAVGSGENRPSAATSESRRDELGTAPSAEPPGAGPRDAGGNPGRDD